MGQYFGAYIENTKDSDDYHVFMTWGCLKLMEHSWLKNDMVAAVMEKLVDSPHKVAWIGDYSNENSTEINGMTSEEFDKRYIRVFPQDEKDNDMSRFTNIF